MNRLRSDVKLGRGSPVDDYPFGRRPVFTALETGRAGVITRQRMGPLAYTVKAGIAA